MKSLSKKEIKEYISEDLEYEISSSYERNKELDNDWDLIENYNIKSIKKLKEHIEWFKFITKEILKDFKNMNEIYLYLNENIILNQKIIKYCKKEIEKD